MKLYEFCVQELEYSTADGAGVKASWHVAVSLFLGLLQTKHTFTSLHSTTLWVSSLITTNQYSISP